MTKLTFVSVAFACLASVAQAQSIVIDTGNGGDGAAIRIPGLTVNSGTGGGGATVNIGGGAGGTGGTGGEAPAVNIGTGGQGATVNIGTGGEVPAVNIGGGAAGEGAGLSVSGGNVNLTGVRVEQNGSVTMGEAFDQEAFVRTMQASGGAVNLLIHFEFNSDQLTEAGKAQVERVADALWDLDDDAVIVVEGHTDSVGSDEYNLDLSNRRARTVMAALMIDHDVAQKLVQSGKGEAEPIASNETDEGRALNRRVTFIRK